MMPPQIHRKPAHNDRHGRVRTTSDEEQRAVLDVVLVMGCDQDREPGDADRDGDEREEEAVAQLVTKKSDEHAEAKGGGPGGHTVELCLDGGVAVGFDDAGREVSVSLRSRLVFISSGVLLASEHSPVCGHDQTEVHQSTKEKFIVLEAVNHVLESDGAFEGGFALVVAETAFDEGFFFRG